MGEFDYLIPRFSTGTASKNEFADLIPGTVRQVAGEVPTKEYFKSIGRGALKGVTLQNLTPQEEETPGMRLGETVGSFVPVVAADALIPEAAAITPVVKAGLSGMLFGAAKGAVNQTPILQQISDIGKSGLAFMGGERIAKGAGKLFEPFSGAVTPELEAGRAAAESVGIKATLGNLTQSKSVQTLERGLEFMPFGAAITKMRMKALEGLKNFTEDVSKQIAPNLPAEVRGGIIQKKFVDLFKSYHEQTGKMYDLTMPIIRAANPEVETERTINALQKVIEQRGGAEFLPPGLSEVQKTLENIIGKETGSKMLNAQGEPFLQKLPSTIKVFDVLKKSRTNLGDRLASGFDNLARSGLKNDLEGVYGAMTEDMNATIAKVSPQAAADFQAAGAMNQKARDFVESDLFNAIEKTEPQNVYKLIITPKSPSKVEMGKEILGDKFPQVAAQWFDDVVKNSTKDGIVSPVKLRDQLDKYAEVIPNIAGGSSELLQSLNKARQISSLLAKGRDVSQGSITAFTVAGGTSLMAALGIVEALFRNPRLAAEIAGGVAATGVTTAGMLTGAGREFLTRGFPRVGKVAAKILQPATQIGLQKIADREIP